jgi:hypothetical protein
LPMHGRHRHPHQSMGYACCTDDLLTMKCGSSWVIWQPCPCLLCHFRVFLPCPYECAAGPPVNSRLGAIVTAYLRQQHRAACLTAAQPMSVVPPVSLLKPYSLPVATRPLNAPANVTLRLARQEFWGGFGGRGRSHSPAATASSCLHTPLTSMQVICNTQCRHHG